MRFQDLIRVLEPSFDLSQAKLHMARWNGFEDPMDLYLQGRFDEWQEHQTGRNFKRPLVVGLIQARQANQWLFAGLFRSLGYVEDRSMDRLHYRYQLERVPSTVEFEGRLFLRSGYKSRSSYLRGETLADDLEVAELLPERVSLRHFPGFKAVDISKAELDLMVRANNESWRTALSSVKGVYLISDQVTGRLYVGKADGEDGVWGRWCAYAATGHGGNAGLKEEIGTVGSERQQDLRFSLLEIADIQSTKDEIAKRESHWKNILRTRQTGFNRN
ncbi:MAG: GIY-YIG nuclease family protein [Lysobacteraceae bacterium]